MGHIGRVFCGQLFAGCLVCRSLFYIVVTTGVVIVVVTSFVGMIVLSDGVLVGDLNRHGIA